MSKYGRLTSKNRALYKADVNFLYWQTACCMAMIARNLGISETSVKRLIESKPDHLTYEDTPRPSQRGQNL